jgi:superfamily II DNA or RNA helicase
MPHIFDNIESALLPALEQTLTLSTRSDFAVGYFNLRGWKQIDCHIEKWNGSQGNCCRLLVGMQKAPSDELRELMRITERHDEMDTQTLVREKLRLAKEFREQLMVGIPTNADEAGLRRLANQIRAKKLTVKLYLRHNLHAKLYLCFRPDPITPIVGYVGSSNLTLSGLSYQGELNVDVVEQDAAKKLAKWFEDRWNDRWCVDISDELVQVIEESWARTELIPPYHIYLKIAYHLSREARAGLSEYSIPAAFRDIIFDYQAAAVKIAARHLHKRGGVIIGDVVGLGKTLMATTLARMFEDLGMETLILCPKNLVKMWNDYRVKYGLRGTVLSVTRAIRDLPDLPRHRVVLIDESHNFRNRDGKVYRAIRDYIDKNESRCILLTATPYNKTYLDLANQLRLFLPEDRDLGIRPERYLKQIGDMEFTRRHQASPRSLAAFEKSDWADDWRELMRLFMVRRTRSFIQANYAKTDRATGRKYLPFSNGDRSYFPTRTPRTLKYTSDAQYTTLYEQDVVDIINALCLPRYGLGNYENKKPARKLTESEIAALKDLSRAGKRLMGFCRTNLFKRLESSGYAFLLSVERHILRNAIFLHALENDLPLPIGTQGAEMLDETSNDEDADAVDAPDDLFEEDKGEEDEAELLTLRTFDQFQQQAAVVYARYATEYKKRFRWLAPALFDKNLAKDLRADCDALLQVLNKCPQWNPDDDSKLAALRQLLARDRPNDKVLIFTQFADTARYLGEQLAARGITRMATATGKAADPTELAWRFSPVSNERRSSVKPEDELRVLVATDVLSEGQNLQDCFIVVNYDLPWAIIRLIQRAGRVDRIGQRAEEIHCCSFLPAQGVEKIIRLRQRVSQRLTQNAEVVGTDEAFFEDEAEGQKLLDLYHEKAGVLDEEDDGEVDLASRAYQIWKNATEDKPELEKLVEEMPSVVFSTKAYTPTPDYPPGVLVYLQTAQGNDALAWIDADGRSVTESQSAILRMAACEPNTPALPRHPDHHDIVAKGVGQIIKEESTVGGQLGRPSGARFRTYERLKRYAEQNAGGFFNNDELQRVIGEIYRFPLTQAASDRINSHLRAGINDEGLVNLVLLLRDENRLCVVMDDEQKHEPRIICSLGLSSP